MKTLIQKNIDLYETASIYYEPETGIFEICVESVECWVNREHFQSGKFSTPIYLTKEDIKELILQLTNILTEE